MKQSMGSWAAFLGCCFLVVGLMGGFASYAGQIPLERAISRIQVLDRIVDASHGPDPAARIAALRPLLGDRGGLLDGAGPTDDRVSAERLAAITEGLAESDAVAGRVRLLLVFVTLMAGLFGIGILFISRRG